MSDETKNIEEREVSDMNNDELKGAIEQTLSKIRRQSMLLGGQAICQVILNKIVEFERTPGNKSNNDHKRLIKEIKKFTETGLSRSVNTDGTTNPIADNVDDGDSNG